MAAHEILHGYREDLFNVTLTVEGIVGKEVNQTILRSLVVDKMTGGGAKGKDTKYRPANGTENQLSLGGPREIDNITLTRLYDQEVMPSTGLLLENAGRAKVTVSKEPLDENGHGLGAANTLTYIGRLIDVTPPPTDSEGDKASTIEFVVSLETNVAS